MRTITDGILVNEIFVASAPMLISGTGTGSFTINYSAVQNGSIWIGLFDSSWNYAGGSVHYPVNAGECGEAKIDLTLENIPEGTGYIWLIQLRDANNNAIEGVQKIIANVVLTP